PVLSVQGLTTSFASRRGDVNAVSDVTFSMARGERLAIVGESGSGKSTLALSLLKLLPRAGRISAGSVQLNGRDLIGLGEDELRHVRGKEVGVVFQDPMTSLNPVIRIRDQMVPPICRHLKLTPAAAQSRAIELLAQVGIPDPAARISAYPHELSGGMRQRVLIAMALSCGPDLVIADEPTTALDVTIQAQIVALLKGLAEHSGTSVLFVTHDFGLVARFAHTIAVMYAGRIVEYGPSERVFHRPEHPYTRALLESIPAITGPKPARLTQIDGVPPDLARLGPGCSFAPRCNRATDRCGEIRPELTVREPEHTAACWVSADSPMKETAHVAVA
ncbi:MAG: ABC transporter ATP-binding protein, partial [Chloroflexota bacterium]